MDTGGSTAGYYFLWFAGADTTSGTFLGNNADVDSSAVLDNRSAGQYTVVAIDSTSGCSSAEVTFQIDENPSTPTATLNAYGSGSKQNTTCDIDLVTSGDSYNGALQITPDFGVVADFSFIWHTGTANAVAAANQISAATFSGVAGFNSDSLYNIPGGTYSVIMTHTASTCSDTLQFAIADDLTGTTPVVDNTTPEVQ